MMRYELMPSSNHRTPAPQPRTQRSFCLSDDGSQQKKKSIPICFQYVNPSLLLEWQGEPKVPNQISGPGIFCAYLRSKDDAHQKSKLILSLQSQKWRNGQPIGPIKLTQIFFYDSLTRSDNLIKQIHKFAGRLQSMKKQGYGEYAIEYYYSNQTKQNVEIKGYWEKDFIVEGQISGNGVKGVREIRRGKFVGNVEIGTADKNTKESGKDKEISIQGIQLVVNQGKDRKSQRKILDGLVEKNDNQKILNDKEEQKQKGTKNILTNLLVPPQIKPKQNQKNVR